MMLGLFICKRKRNHVVFHGNKMAGRSDSQVEFVQLDGLVSNCIYK